LQKKSREEKVEDIIKFTGRVSNYRLNLFYSAADIFIIPSYYEPFGLVALEGMASKIPIVASQVGGLKNIIEDNETGLLFEPRNPVKLKEKIMAVYRSKEFADKLIRNASEEVKKYSWTPIAEKINDIYQSLIINNRNENSPNSAV